MAKRSSKPSVPKSFPLKWHSAVRQWYKWHKGKQFYFGVSAEEALKRFNLEWPHILEGGSRPVKTDCTVRELCNKFLERREEDIGKSINERTFAENLSILRIVIGAIGGKSVKGLLPDDFRAVRKGIASSSPQVMWKRIGIVRGLFNWALEEGVIDQLPRYGTSMKRPPLKEVRIYRAKLVSPVFTAEEVRTFIDASGPLMKAFILTALNCGFYAVDLSGLLHRHINGEFADYPREKTGIPRRAWLWPETREAIAAVATDPKSCENVFTGPRGGRLVHSGTGTNRVDAVSGMFSRLKRNINYHRENSGFKNFRHVFRTVVDASGDISAIRRVMGHADRSIDDTYVHHISDERLRAVSEYVRRWLWPDAPETK